MNGRIPPVRLLAWAGIGLCLAGSHALLAQQGAQPPAPPLPPPINQSDDPILKRFVWRSIGPANMGGRVDDIAVNETSPSTFYVGFATGGIWKTTNNGTTWTPIFDKYPVSSIGDIALAPSNPEIIYVGTGEPNNRQSSSFGAGVYKSTDGGKEFVSVGLKETQSIGRVVVHPKDPNIVYVAAVGHLFGPNPERGLYKTTDGGKTWTNTKFIDNDTGFTDVVMDPSNPNVLIAASYQRRRQPWGFNGGGPGSAIWKTTDGAKTWTKLTGTGLPENPIIGRIGLDIARSKPSTIYASIEVGPSGGTGAGVNDDGTLAQPGQGRGGGGRGQVPPPPDPKKSGIWRSDDSGKTWRFLSNQGDRWMYYSQIRVDPTNPEIAYQGGAPFFKSVDGGKNWRQVPGIPHSDHHAIWINPKDNNHILLGNDGGLDVSYDQGETWEYINTMALGQFYGISADMRKPYYVCGGLQDNGSWCGPSGVRSTTGILNSDWFRVGGGDGFYTANDPSDWRVLYSESQDGNTSRLELPGRTVSIRPRPAATGGRGGAAATAPANPETPVAPPTFGPAAGPNVVPTPPPGTNYRFYWSTPFILSPHNPRTIYLGGDRLFRSYDRGDTWTASPDLTNNVGRNDRPIMGVAGTAPMASKHDGAASYSNIVTISESSVVPGILWVGTNDGNVQVSRDGGATWKNVAGNVKGMPKEAHVSRVEASHHDPTTAYVSFDAHRTDDHRPYIYLTKDLGETWASVSGNLPEGNVNVVKEDPKNRNLLYAGTEYGFFISLNAGREWKPFMTGLPSVRIDDVMVHPRDNDLILGTHGRSIWIIDDITALQQLSDDLTKTDEQVLDIRPATAWTNDIQRAILAEGAKHFRGQNPPRGAAISYWLKSAPSADVRITITDITGREIRSLEGTKEAGLNRVQWDLTLAGGRGGRGAGRGGGGAPAAPETQAPGAAAAAPAGQAPAGPQAAQAAQPQRGAGGGGGGGGRGGFAPAVAPGSYLVKVIIGDRVIGQKTLVVEADTLQ
ncbi:MAG TPA: hypothetical protein VFT47_18830 [Vicinamibacterales bacterium]|nr:hypothetical protein [Vicinamibacterales bacterium]